MSSRPPSIPEVLVAVARVFARRAALRLSKGLRGLAVDAPRALFRSGRGVLRRTGSAMRAVAAEFAARAELFAGLVRRALLLGAMGVLAVAGGSLVAARPEGFIPSTPEVFFAAFAVCGGLCIAAPERRLRLGGLAVGTLHGAFAALTWFGTH